MMCCPSLAVTNNVNPLRPFKKCRHLRSTGSKQGRSSRLSFYLEFHTDSQFFGEVSRKQYPTFAPLLNRQRNSKLSVIPTAKLTSSTTSFTFWCFYRTLLFVKSTIHLSRPSYPSFSRASVQTIKDANDQLVCL